jgi:hypothetical protein
MLCCEGHWEAEKSSECWGGRDDNGADLTVATTTTGKKEGKGDGERVFYEKLMGRR